MASLKIKNFGYLLILLGLFVYNSFAIPILYKKDEVTTAINTKDQNSDILDKITGIFLIVVGISLCFFGNRCFKSMLYGIGFMTGLLFSFACLQSVFGNGMNKYLYYIISIVIGLIVGYLAVLSLKLTLCIVGILAGFSVSALLVSIFPSIANLINPLIFSIILAVVFIVLVFFFEQMIIILSTSVFGSYVLFYGIDCFVNLGFATALRTMYDSERFDLYDPNTKIYGMLIGSVVVAVLGSICQYMTYHKE